MPRRKENDDFIELRVDEPEERPSRSSYNMPAEERRDIYDPYKRAPSRNLVQDAMDRLMPRQQHKTREFADGRISKQTAAVEVMKELGSVKLLSILGIVVTLLAAGLGSMTFLGAFGYTPILFLSYFAYKFLTSDRRIKYLRNTYNL